MISPISARTHKDYKFYSARDAIRLHSFIGVLRNNATDGMNTPYPADSFIRHAADNRHKLKVWINEASLNLSDVKIPGNLIFWVYRGCNAMNIKSPIELPHICKVPAAAGEKFYVASKEDWKAHRDVTVNKDKPIMISDHAKLQYLSRVAYMDVEGILDGFPLERLTGEGRTLEDGRVEHEIGDFLFIMDKNVCVTILNKAMVTT